MAVFPLRRREFLAALASSAVLPSRTSSAVRYPVHFRKPSPYESALARVEPGGDEFPFEKQASEVEAALREMLKSRAVPLAPDFRGASPLPLRYKPVAEGVAIAEFGSSATFAEVLPKWIESLGRVRRTGFFALPGNRVRYEIASDGAYRIGVWKIISKDGRISALFALRRRSWLLLLSPGVSAAVFEAG